MATLEPFLSFFSQNRAEYLQVGTLVRLAVMALAVAGALYLVLLTLLPKLDPVRIAAPLAVLVFCFFRYGALAEHGLAEPARSLAMWAVVTALAVAAVGAWSRYGPVSLFLAVFLATMTLQPVVLSAALELGRGVQSGATSSADAAPIPVSDHEARTPDVWWLLFDEYGRADSLDALLDLDNRPFLDELGTRGFDVADDSYTSYPVTALSIASVLDMSYVAAGPGDLETGA